MFRAPARPPTPPPQLEVYPRANPTNNNSHIAYSFLHRWLYNAYFLHYLHSINLRKKATHQRTYTMFNPTPDNHHVVHIGGAQFVPPMMTHFAHVPNFTISPTSEASSSSSMASPSSPSHSRFSSSSSSAASAADSLEEWDTVQAHLNYAKRMADHTALMWQKERLAIEKAKIDGTYTGNVTSRQNGNARPTPESAKASSAVEEKKKGRKFGGLFAIFSPSSAELVEAPDRKSVV